MIKSTEQEEQLKEEITQIPKDKKIKSIEENRLFRKNMDLALKEREKIARDLLIANKVAKLNAEQTKSEKETENIKKKIKKDLEIRELNAELINSGFLKPNDLI